ncbi:class I SAM-dependent methyltransferase [Paractinoplanes atraurantiacus]|uniref:Methyltransferase domain-containing protein n=1 Tax=Paractinoplanes atraurantiacus TaxID=1036182 RepID=A0A285KHL1_9ACTN|nr:class I SAM-dependent methyltransferase [Actinoplanes atraurantiacus]SNY72124.1 Methyltransferase domain-containing protein [Actinoplanes atraurantiacus]
MTIESAFDQRAAAYSDDWHVRYAERLVELAGPSAGTRILDAATGTGLAATAAARAAGPTGHVLGVDISEGMLARARRSAAAPGIELVKADATALPHLPDDSFDLVLCSAGLLYMPVGPALREWRRLLKPGGLVGFSTMREGYPVAARLFRSHAARHGLALTDPATPLGTPSKCRQALEDAGYSPAGTVTETIRFSRSDLEHAWTAHTQGAHHDALTALSPEQTETFRTEYTGALTSLLDTDEDHVLDAEVLYAFGRA